ncbi:hypothetical protein FHW69_000722 [Luteibacter sp. Sphag1AF]|uniref:DUF2782 domain-containing protein n=1 Tax=Luteibacter sp. Sphag1AF TaxID=2587031 RepID=UPI001608A49F|nr:DUF2782 domain-containing protein [Luteibacter sp. Sphag1AF]MBB3226132.1 hypothetical protein [Luteibacter sp. Sphag1AF]
MKRIATVVAVALALAAALPAAAQDSSSQKPQYAPGLPPPGLNDPGTKAGEPDKSGAADIPRPVPYDSAEAGKTTPATTDAQPERRSGTALPSMTDDGTTDQRGQQPPQVTVRQEGDDRVEEYRSGGKLFMVRVTPKNGVPQTYMADSSGKLYHDPKDGPVSPVYYKVYEWGAAPKPAGSGN